MNGWRRGVYFNLFFFGRDGGMQVFQPLLCMKRKKRKKTRTGTNSSPCARGEGHCKPPMCFMSLWTKAHRSSAAE